MYSTERNTRNEYLFIAAASCRAADQIHCERTAAYSTGYWHASVMRSVRAVSSASPSVVVAL